MLVGDPASVLRSSSVSRPGLIFGSGSIDFVVTVLAFVADCVSELVLEFVFAHMVEMVCLVYQCRVMF